MKSRWPKRLLKGLGRWTLRSLVGLVALVVVALTAGLVFLRTPAGGALARNVGVKIANQALAGKVEVGSLTYLWNGVRLTNVRLLDPAGDPVAEIDQVEAHVALGRLALSLAKEIRLTRVELDGPRVWLLQDEDGTNLARAIAPREKKPEEPKSDAPSTLRVVVERFALKGGMVRLTQVSPDEDRTTEVTELGIEADVDYGGRAQNLGANLALDGRMTRPLAGPLQLRLRSDGTLEALAASVALEAPGLSLAAQGNRKGDRLFAELEKLRAEARTVRAFVPAYPLTVPVTAHAKATRNGDGAEANAQVSAASARVTLDADADANLGARRVDHFRLGVTGVNLGELLENAPATAIALEASGKLGGHDLGTLDGLVELRMPPARIRGETVGPIAAKLSAHRGSFAVADLLVALPGLKITGDGEGTDSKVRFGAKLVAADLKRLGRTFSGLGTLPELPLSGSGALTVELAGPLKSPSVRAQGSFGSVAMGTTRVQNLTLSADVPSLARVLDADVELKAADVQLGAKRLKDVRVFLSTEGPVLDGGVGVGGDHPFTIAFGGTADADARGLELARLELKWPASTWALERPAKLRLIGTPLRIEGLSLRSGAQHLALDLRQDGKAIEGRVQMEAFALAGLPTIAIPKVLGLAGQLDLDVAVKGRLPRPNLEAKVLLEGGRFRQLRDLRVALEGTYRNDRAVGTLELGMNGPRLRAAVDVPIQGLLRGRHQAVSIEAELPAQRLEELTCAASLTPEQRNDRLCAIDTPAPLEGRVAGKVALTGYGDAPKLDLTLDGDSLLYGPSAGGAFHLQAGTQGKSGTLQANLDAELLRGKLTAIVTVPRTLASLIAHPPQGAALDGLPLTVVARGEKLQLAGIEETGLSPRPLRGLLAFGANVTGTLAAPTGDIDVTLRNLETPGVPGPVDSDIAVRATDRAVRFNLTGRRREAQIARVRASLAAPLGDLRVARKRSHAPLEVYAVVGPLHLEDLPQRSNDRDATLLKGSATASIVLTGSLDDPEATVTADLEGLGQREAKELGDVAVKYTYAKAKHEVEGALTSAGGGLLALEGRTTLDLSARALAEGLQPSRAPLDARLSSDGFRLDFLSQLSPTLRRVAGTLEVDARVDGTIGAPTGKGRVEWKDGALTLAGFGAYEAIHLLASASNDEIALSDLRVTSGNGKLHLKADAKRNGGTFHLTGYGALSRFPIITDDQPVANVTLKTTLEGELSASRVEIGRLSIPEATVELPQVKRKDLQSLTRPGDVVLVRNGVPINPPKKEDEAGTGGAGADGVRSAPALRTYGITIDAPRNLWVKSGDINAEAGLSPGFRVEYRDAPTIAGQVRVLRGRADLLGRRFDVQRDSTARFTGPADQPMLDLTAVHDNQKEGVRVFITVRGQGKRVQIKTRSEPPLSESEIYTLIATGRRTLRAGNGPTASMGDQAASILGGFAAAQLKQALRDKLPLDVLSIEAGGEGYGLVGAKLEAGTYVTDKLYVGYQGQLGADRLRGQNANAARVEYQFTPRWSLEASYGDANVGGADFVWSKDF